MNLTKLSIGILLATLIGLTACATETAPQDPEEGSAAEAAQAIDTDGVETQAGCINPAMKCCRLVGSTCMQCVRDLKMCWK